MSRREVFEASITPLAVAALSSNALLPSFNDADAELLRLGEEWERSKEADDAAWRWVDKASDAYERVPIPEALFQRSSDFHFFFGFTGQPCRWDGIEGNRRWYRFDLDYLRNLKVPDHWPDETKRKAHTRALEILAANDAWDKENDDRRAACGLTAAEAAADITNEENKRLRQLILGMRATTIDGMRLKARIFAWCHSESLEEIQNNDAADRLDGDASDERFLYSIVIDLLRHTDEARLATVVS